jgi:hypothetical protein
MADKKLSDEQKEALAELRKRMGGVSEAKRQLKTQLAHDGKAIVAVLAKSPATVPEIAAATQLSKRHVLWCLAGMRKYGQVTDGDADGDYPRYAIVKED